MNKLAAIIRYILQWPLCAARRPLVTMGIIVLCVSIFRGGWPLATAGLFLMLVAEVCCALSASILANYKMLYFLETKLQQEGMDSYEEIESEELDILQEDARKFLGRKILPMAVPLISQPTVGHESYRVLTAKPEAIVAQLKPPEIFTKSDGRAVVFLPMDPRSEALEAWERFYIFHEFEHASSFGIVNEQGPVLVMSGTVILCIVSLLISGLDPWVVSLGFLSIMAVVMDNAVLRPGRLEARTDLRALMRFAPDERRRILKELVRYFKGIYNSSENYLRRSEAGQRAVILDRAALDETWLSETNEDALHRGMQDQEGSDPSWIIASCLVFTLCTVLVLRHFDDIGLRLYLGSCGLAATFLFVTLRSYCNAVEECGLASSLMETDR